MDDKLIKNDIYLGMSTPQVKEFNATTRINNDEPLYDFPPFQ
jgi:hypothetical protein